MHGVKEARYRADERAEENDVVHAERVGRVDELVLQEVRHVVDLHGPVGAVLRGPAAEVDLRDVRKSE